MLEHFDRGDALTTPIDRIAQASFAGYKLTHGEPLEEDQVKNIRGYVQDIAIGYVLTARTKEFHDVHVGLLFDDTVSHIHPSLNTKKIITVPSSHGERDYVAAINHFVTTYGFLRKLRVTIPEDTLSEDNSMLATVKALENWRSDPTRENVWNKIRTVQKGTHLLLENGEIPTKLHSLRDDTTLFYFASEKLIGSIYLPHEEEDENENQSTTFGESIV